MKKYSWVLILVLIMGFSLCGCSKKYTIGSKGPAGGYIFYDCDADNGSGNADGLTSSECGWRYLEAAPEDLEGSYSWGSGSSGSAGRTGLGDGKSNTDDLVFGTTITSLRYPAAKACYNYTCGGYSDWFLPSRDELNAMYINLAQEKKGGKWESDYYWSSSEGGFYNAWFQDFSSGHQGGYGRYGKFCVRPVRAFL